MGIKQVEKLTVNDMKPIALSFKKNDEELELYKWIMNHSNMSGFIKDTLRAAMNEDGIRESKDKNTVKVETTNNDGLINFDF
jgi:hypothetical protein